MPKFEEAESAKHELGPDDKIANLMDELIAMQARLEASETERKQLRKRNEWLESVAPRDFLTGLLNRRGGREEFERIVDEQRPGPEAKERRKKSQQISVLALDIDHFKDVNDTYGHEAGDVVLRTVAQKLKAGVRKGDLAIREGGEEMLLVFKGMDAATAYNILYKKFGNQNRTFKPGEHPQIGFPVDVQGPDGKTVTLQITFSGGIVDLGENASFEEAKEAADKLLYKAKGSGRNRILRFGPVEVTPPAVGSDEEQIEERHEVQAEGQ